MLEHENGYHLFQVLPHEETDRALSQYLCAECRRVIDTNPLQMTQTIWLALTNTPTFKFVNLVMIGHLLSSLYTSLLYN